MRSFTFADRKYECLATSITLVFGSCALRFAMTLPEIEKVLFGVAERTIHPWLPRLVFQNPGWITAGVVMLIAISFVAIWSRHRFAALVAAGGIASLGIVTQILWSASTSVWWTIVAQLDG